MEQRHDGEGGQEEGSEGEEEGGALAALGLGALDVGIVAHGCLRWIFVFEREERRAAVVLVGSPRILFLSGQK